MNLIVEKENNKLKKGKGEKSEMGGGPFKKYHNKVWLFMSSPYTG